MPGPFFLEGDRVDLRTIEQDDIEFLQEGMNHPAIRRYTGVDVPYSRPQYEDSRFDAVSTGDGVELLVCEDDERLGSVSLAPIDERQVWVNLGYWIHPDHQGEGYATEAARLAVSYGFTELRLHRISAQTIAHNEDSKRVIEKLGFVYEGTKRDDAFLDGTYIDREVYALLCSDWSP